MPLTPLYHWLLTCACYLCISCQAQPKSSANLDFEVIDAGSGIPANWTFSRKGTTEGYVTRLDSTVVQQGKYAVSITKEVQGADGHYGLSFCNIPATFKGTRLKLTGYLKTQDVSGGFAGIYIRTEGNGGVLQLNNMIEKGVTGTTDWKEYSVELVYNEQKTKTIAVGALLSGSGKVWVDNLHFTVDGQPHELAAPKQLIPAALDTAYNSGSGIHQISLSDKRIRQLTDLGMLWGFLKYYHPAIAAGRYNWDAELFRMLHALLPVQDDAGVYAVMEQWVDKLGPVAPCKDCSDIDSIKIRIMPDYGYLFQPQRLPASLVKKLAFIRDNYKTPASHYYVEIGRAGNPMFGNEQTFGTNAYPDAGVRLLALYQYWNIIQYFFPSRHLISGDWHQVLSNSLQPFAGAANKTDYMRACLRLIASINDSHAGIWGGNAELDTLRGPLMVPFLSRFISGELVTTAYYKDTLGITQLIKVGDVITTIDGQPVQKLVEKYLPLTPASNYETQLRDLPSAIGFLLRGSQSQVQLGILRDGKRKMITVPRIPVKYTERSMDLSVPAQTTGYKMLPGNIGYIYPGKLNKSDFHNIQRRFANTRGLIIDFRCYPATFMPIDYSRWLKATASPMVSWDVVSLSLPGAIIQAKTTNTGEHNDSSYRGKVVMLVDNRSQSQSEFTVMAFQTIPGSVVIGSTTAGADGDISMISLPGNIKTYISGLGVYYPDGTQAQRTGVKIDIPMKPTLQGIREGKDELLEAAIKTIIPDMP